MILEHLDGNNETNQGNSESLESKESKDRLGQKFKNAFAKVVKAQREERSWSQSDLAQQTRFIIPVRTISDLETAQKAVLDHKTISYLADAFGVEGLLREEFFAAAGLIVDRVSLGSIRPADQEMLLRMYEKTPFPALVQDPLLFIHSVNSIHFGIFGKVPPSTAGEPARRPNILRIIFHPEFEERTGVVNNEAWRTFVDWTVFMFRNSSQKYMHLPEYAALIKELRTRKAFREVWQRATRPKYIPQSPLPIVFQFANGHRYEFIVTRALMPMLPTAPMNMILYFPVDAATKDYCTEMSEGPRFVILFDGTPPNGYSVVHLENRP